MALGPITSWQIDGETVADFIFWGSKITADGDCSHENIPGHPKEMEVCAPLLFSPQGFLIGLLLLWLLSLPQTSAFSMDNFGFKDSHEI